MSEQSGIPLFLYKRLRLNVGFDFFTTIEKHLFKVYTGKGIETLFILFSKLYTGYRKFIKV